MNTPTHLIFAAAAFAKPEQRKVNCAVLFGGIIPDLSLYLLFIWHRFVLNTSTNEIFGKLYFSEPWQFIFAIDNSFFIWGGVFALATYLKKPWLFGLSGAAFLHLMFDFPLHHDDARAHFWPLTSWRFESPISYWDPNHFGNIISLLEISIAAVLLVILWRRFKTRLPRVLILIGSAFTVFPYVLFVIVMQLGAGHTH